MPLKPFMVALTQDIINNCHWFPFSQLIVNWFFANSLHHNTTRRALNPRIKTSRIVLKMTLHYFTLLLLVLVEGNSKPNFDTDFWRTAVSYCKCVRLPSWNSYDARWRMRVNQNLIFHFILEKLRRTNLQMHAMKVLATNSSQANKLSKRYKDFTGNGFLTDPISF